MPSSVNAISNQDKCIVFGIVVLDLRISISVEMIKGIMNWPTPKNVIAIRSFKGLARYYCRFIKGF